ncbi:MAG: hypothetical protein M1480_16395 [Bacteroidetes bacterium]|nr:hypothetical protein [Bacteroidota bacterium]
MHNYDSLTKLDDDFGLHEHHNNHGEVIGFSQKNIFGGHNYYDSHHQFKGYTADNVFHGHDYINAHGMHLGNTVGTDFHSGDHNFTNSAGHIVHQPSALQTFHDPFSHHQIHEHFSGVRSNLLNQIS